MNEQMKREIANEREPRFKALIPFLVFIVFYLGLSILANDFYKVPMPIAFLVASASAMFLNHKIKLETKVEIYAHGMGDVNIMLMCLIFILAGSFAAVAKGMGAVDAAVLITRKLIPADFMLVGMFLVSALISTSIGTSCGTIAAITPIVCGLVKPLGLSPELMIGAVVGGSMFGDNLSMISDTTIAATRTQNVGMREKFIANFRMVIPAAVIAIVIYLICGFSGGSAEKQVLDQVTWKSLLAVTPYFLILVLALCGVNVMALLFGGVILACGIGLVNGAFDFWSAMNFCKDGMAGMLETLIVAILAGGLLKLIRWNGGIGCILRFIGKAVKTQRGCEFGVFALVSLINLFTANNTVAIVIAGPIAHELSMKFGCSPKRIASILDTASCFVQGVIPYGAQILIAVGVANTAELKLSAIGLVGSAYYQWIMAIVVLLFIAFRRQSKTETQNV